MPRRACGRKQRCGTEGGRKKKGKGRKEKEKEKVRKGK
jgi:hypothetical protein